jgi:NAD(P)-dependent dehydrogenase (short-subunit alcohol dehydrogenase family)
MHHRSHPAVVVITGASAGVGRATARAFGRQRANIGLIARGQGALEAAKREIVQLGGRALVLPLDVADWEAMDRAASAVEEEFGPIDVWINNAMVSVFSPFLEMTPEEFKRVTEVTYLGYVHGTLAALRRMKPRDRGIVIQVGSALAYRGIPLQSAYCGAKHAIEGFTESVRCELLHDGSQVRLTMVQLPALNTPQFSWVKSRLPRKPQPVPPIYQPEVAARAIVWAATHERRELNVGLSTSLVVVGNKFAAGLGDQYLARTGYESQMTEAPAQPDRPDNLWKPLPGDRGAHGEFGARAHERSMQFWATTHRALLAVAAIGGLAALGCLWRNNKPSNDPANH